jgi:hypothetical protein
MRHARQAAAEHDDVGVEDVDDAGERARQARCVPLESRRRRGVAACRCGGDRFRIRPGGRRGIAVLAVVARQAWPADQRLDAADLAAVTTALRVAGRHGPGQRVVSTLAGDAVGPGEHAVVQGILDYVERLTATFDAPLSTAILTCTGSEANDIALRMAEAMTGKRGIVATDAIYHGNTALVSHLSKSDEPEVGFGLGPYLRHVDAPDSHRIPDPDGGRFAAHVERAIAVLGVGEHTAFQVEGIEHLSGRGGGRIVREVLAVRHGEAPIRGIDS